MRSSKKKGFTLVELMIVIVIMGILAAIGVPKLWSHVAKAKASEVGPAATSYIKLQNAYVMEHGAMGNWKRIGYTKPKSDNFKYENPDITKKMKADDLGETGKVGWKATNKVGLGDCTLGNDWTVTILKNGTDDEGNTLLEYKAEVSSSNCLALSGDWSVVGGNTQVAAANTKKGSPLTASLYQSKTDADGNMTLAKAIMSSDGMIGKGYQSYGVDGFVDKKSVTNAATKKWITDQLPAGVKTSSIKVVTEFDTDETTLSAGKVYKGTASLYYGSESDNLDRLDLYGTKVIYGKLASDGTKIEYFLDPNATEESKIEINSYTGWENNYKQEIDDPMKKDWASSDYVSPISSEDAPGFSAIAKDIIGGNQGSGTSGFNTKHSVEGYIVTQGQEGTTLSEALTAKSITPGTIKVVTEMHTSDTKLAVGTLYAATQSLLYGSANDAHVYGTAVIYALVTKESGNALFYEDKECTKPVYPRKDLSYWDSFKK